MRIRLWRAGEGGKALEARELASQIETAIDTLSIDRRVAVRLHLTGYDREDIARVLGWTEARTRNHWTA